MTLKDYFDLPMENRFDGNKTRSKKTSFEIMVESQIRDGGALNVQNGRSMEGKRRAEIYLRCTDF